MKNKIDIKKELKENKYKDLNRTVIQVVIFDLICITCGAVGFLNIDIFLALIFAVILPALFSTHVCLSALKANKQITNKEFWKGFGTYYSMRSPLYGSYRVWKGVLKAFLAYLIASMIFSVIYMNIVGDDFVEALNLFMESWNESDYDALTTLLEENEALANFYSWDFLISSTAAAIMFMWHILKNFLNVNTRVVTGVFGPKRGNIIFRRTWRANRGEIWGDYFKYAWFIYLGVFIFVGAGAVVPFILGLTFEYCLVIGITAGILYISFCLPYFVSLMEILTEKYLPRFEEEVKSTVDIISSQLSMNNMLNEQEKKNLEKIKAMMDALNKESSENDDNVIDAESSDDEDKEE